MFLVKKECSLAYFEQNLVAYFTNQGVAPFAIEPRRLPLSLAPPDSFLLLLANRELLVLPLKSETKKQAFGVVFTIWEA